MAKISQNLGGASKKPLDKKTGGGAGLPPSTVPQATVQTLLQHPTKMPAATVDPHASSGSSGDLNKIHPSPQSGGSASPTGGGSYVQEESVEYAGPEEFFDLEFHMPEPDAESTQLYEQALADLHALEAAQPQYTSQYDAQISDLYEQLLSRGRFRYDSATDPLYQQYKQDYARQGQAAMRDTMGQAAALTGGYGSSYSQSAGQQQYNAYLQRLAEVLPDTYSMALNAWTTEGSELQGRYDAAVAAEKSDYDRYLDELGQYNKKLGNARSDAQTAYERKRAIEQEAYERAVDDYNRRLAAEKLAYQRFGARTRGK